MLNSPAVRRHCHGTRWRQRRTQNNHLLVPFHVSFTKPLELRTGSKSGGLSDDVLSKSAKDYFYASSDKGARAAALEDATPEQRKVLAQQLRDEVMEASSTSPYASQMAALGDQALIDIMK